jgi:hypothetical protein
VLTKKPATKLAITTAVVGTGYGSRRVPGTGRPFPSSVREQSASPATVGGTVGSVASVREQPAAGASLWQNRSRRSPKTTASTVLIAVVKKLSFSAAITSGCHLLQIVEGGAWKIRAGTERGGRERTP